MKAVNDIKNRWLRRLVLTFVLPIVAVPIITLAIAQEVWELILMYGIVWKGYR